MPIASFMGETSDAREEPGAPKAPDAIDPELIKLSRAPSRIGVVTSLGVVILSIVFMLRLNGDRRFGGEDTPRAITSADVVAGKVDDNSYVTLHAEPMMSHALRVGREKGSIGMRVVPARGTGDKLWLVVDGNGWDAPTAGAYTGRLRLISELPFADALHEFAAAHPRPLFATGAATRAGFSTDKVTGVGGEALALADGDRVAADVVDPNAATIVASINSSYPTVQKWVDALASAGIVTGPPQPGAADLVRFDVKAPDAVATTTRALEAAKLYAARVDPVEHHYETTWGTLKGSTAAGFNLGDATVPDAQLDLVGLYVAKAIPSGAYAVIVGEQPDQYWYVLPITLALAVIGLLFAWSFVRVLRRDVLRA